MYPKITKIVTTLIVAALLITVTTSVFAAPALQEQQDIVDTAVADGRFTTLVTALEAAGLVETLQGEGPFTVFAPTDEAFAALPEGALDDLLANPDQLTNVLLYHVVPGQVMAADVVTLESADTVLGQPVSITVDGDSVMVNDANIIITDIETSNGVIHVIDAVLLPPTDESAMMAEEAMAMDIVDTAVADGRFTTLATALGAAGLIDTLKGEGPFTVFAPTDEAFAALPEGALDDLLANPDQLTNVLLYHVVPGQVMAADVVTLDSADTVLGQPVSISVVGGSVMINEATVIIPDVEASNGVIHVIDAVLLPPSDESAMMAEEAMGETVASCEDYTVQADDWLSKISDKFLGDILAYPAIVDATNAAAAESSRYAVIDNPDVIEIGQVVCIPTDTGEGETMEEPVAEGNTIVDIAVADGRFTTLVAALETAGLVETLLGEGPFTVFAPTDDAFAALPEGALDDLLANPDELTNVLLYHVVPGQVMAADVVTLDSADTVLGQAVDITVDGDSVLVNEATVIIPDIEASNGVIHVIDSVLIPASQ